MGGRFCATNKVNATVRGFWCTALALGALAVGLVPATVCASPSHGGYSGTEISTTETNAEAARTVVSVVTSRISTMLMPTAFDRVGQQANAMGQQQTGRSAGEADLKYGAWGSGAISFMHDSATETKNNGTLSNVLVGMDYKLTDKLVAGVAIGYEHLYLKTNYNSGSMLANGISITPYVGYSITDNLTVDALVGYTRLSSDMRSTVGIVSYKKSDYESNRYMFATNLNYRLPASIFDTIFSAGYMYSNERSQSYSASADTAGVAALNVNARDAYVGELRGGARIERVFGERFTPYAGAYYLYDTSLSSSARTRDYDAVEFVGGLDARISDRMHVGLELSDTCFRRNEDSARVGLNFRYEW